MLKWLEELFSVVRFYQKDQEHVLDKIERMEAEIDKLSFEVSLLKKATDEDGK